MQESFIYLLVVFHFFLSLSFEILTGKEIIKLSTYSAVMRQSVVDGRCFAKG